MAQRRLVIDITENEVLRELVHEAISAHQPVILRVRDKDVASIEALPVATTDDVLGDDAADTDFRDFSATYGAMSDLDGETWKRNARAARGSRRSPVDL